MKALQWRTRELDFGSLDRLRDSLREAPREMRLTRARMADDTIALENVSHDREVTALATSREAVSRLWDVCQVPDYRKISTQDHAELVATLYKFIMGPEGRIPVDWFAKQVAFADRTDGDIDTLSTRIAHIRTWTFVSNRADWLADPEHWQERTRAIEDSLSDALHERLTQRFIDRRTSALMRGLKEKDELFAEIAEDGAVHVEKHYVGRLQGFRFFPDTQAEGIHGKATRNAAAHVLASELAMRARRVAAAKSDAFKLTRRGQILWRDERDRAAGGRRRSAQASGHRHRRRAPERGRQGKGAGAADGLACRADRRAAEAAGRDRGRQGHHGAWRAGSLSASARASAPCAARPSPRRCARSTSPPARSCATTACASAPSTSTSRRCSSRHRPSWR